MDNCCKQRYWRCKEKKQVRRQKDFSDYGKQASCKGKPKQEHSSADARPSTKKKQQNFVNFLINKSQSTKSVVRPECSYGLAMANHCSKSLLRTIKDVQSLACNEKSKQIRK